jgi:hypothetical protein
VRQFIQGMIEGELEAALSRPRSLGPVPSTTLPCGGPTWAQARLARLRHHVPRHLSIRLFRHLAPRFSREPPPVLLCRPV